MNNYRLRLRFDGAAFHGWQIQPRDDTVQQRIFDAATVIFGAHSPIYGCSRTDAGVHALEYYCNFRAEKTLPCDVVVRAMNANLPDTIAVLDCDLADETFHAQFDCAGKTYLYRYYDSRIRDPFLVDRAWHVKTKLDEMKMDRAAAGFIGTHDFAGFCASGASVKTTVRTVSDARVFREGDCVFLRISADGFLYNMVRIIAGTLADVSRGKLDAEAIPEIIASRDRERAGMTAPAQGLSLERVYYEGVGRRDG